MDDYRSGTADGNKVDIWDCNGTSAQAWTWGLHDPRRGTTAPAAASSTRTRALSRGPERLHDQRTQLEVRTCTARPNSLDAACEDDPAERSRAFRRRRRVSR